MRALKSLESNLNDTFGKQAPPLPIGAKKFLVEYLPWINLIIGLLTLYSVYNLWHWAHYVNAFLNNLNSIYGGSAVVNNRMSFGLWLGLIVLTVEALLYIAAFPGTRDRKKSGWNLLFYALLLNVVYGVVVMFTSYGGFGSLLGTVIGSAIGLYFLFQIRPSYKNASAQKKA